MSKYVVSITETLWKIVTVEAKDVDEAWEKVHDAYNCCEIELDSSDMVENAAIEVNNKEDFELDGTEQHIE